MNRLSQRVAASGISDACRCVIFHCPAFLANTKSRRLIDCGFVVRWNVTTATSGETKSTLRSFGSRNMTESSAHTERNRITSLGHCAEELTEHATNLELVGTLSDK